MTTLSTAKTNAIRECQMKLLERHDFLQTSITFYNLSNQLQTHKVNHSIDKHQLLPLLGVITCHIGMHHLPLQRPTSTGDRPKTFLVHMDAHGRSNAKKK